MSGVHQTASGGFARYEGTNEIPVTIGADGAITPGTSTPMACVGTNCRASDGSTVNSETGARTPPGDGNPGLISNTDLSSSNAASSQNTLDAAAAEAVAKNSEGYRSNTLGGASKLEEQSTDSCAMSGALGEGCDGTRAIIEGAKVTNQLTQTIGAAATQIQGQAAQQTALVEGTQSAAMEAAADTQINSGKMQVAGGTMNALLGAVQLWKMGSHKSTAGEMRRIGSATVAVETNAASDTQSRVGTQAGQEGHTTTSGGGRYASEAFAGANLANRGVLSKVTISEADLGAKQREFQQVQAAAAAGDTSAAARLGPLQAEYNQMRRTRQFEREARERGITAKHDDIEAEMKSIGRRASAEQKGVSSEAMAGGMMSLITGAGQMVTGGFNIAAGNKLKDAAGKLADMEDDVPTIAGGQVAALSPVNFGDASVARDGVSIGGSGELGPGQSAAEDEATDETELDLGRGFNPGGNPTGVEGAGPEAGKFGEGGPGGVQKGEGGGLGGGNTSAAQGGGTDDPQAKYATTEKDDKSYDTGGTFTGGGRGGGGGDSGPDLSAMLAQFLPKKEDEAGPKNGILDFGGKGEGGADGPISLLDKNVNIFKRVSETYREKNQKGSVGL